MFPRVSAIFPLDELMANKLNKIQVHFYFGEQDWMDEKGAVKLIKEKLVNGTFNEIENAGH